MKLLSDTSDSIPYIFLVTDGSVDDERSICQLLESHIARSSSLPPRISTFGIGNPLNCSHIRLPKGLCSCVHIIYWWLNCIFVEMIILDSIICKIYFTALQKIEDLHNIVLSMIAHI